ncbi:uncharacterized protein LOC143569175 [Bidens hawaiensis]|uniref:uncharacterized protein LOC143569175 n=1 Tax=Bidens hawaiensis TaxID=980011 RepID=UPI00404B83FC
MENQNQNHIKSQISKFFQSTFNSCRPNTTSNDVYGHHNNRRLIDLFSPKPKPQSSHPKTKTPNFPPKNTQFPPNSSRRSKHSVSPVHEKPAKINRKKKTHHRRRPSNPSFSSITDNYYNNWWSSDDEDDQKSRNTLFSRRSISSNSDESGCVNVVKPKGATGVVAVAKDSSDPYEDFRVSMVDMIVEKELFGVEELENLVECFIKLNDEEHHKVIFEVFAEIWEVLIGDSNKKE